MDPQWQFWNALKIFIKKMVQVFAYQVVIHGHNTVKDCPYSETWYPSHLHSLDF